MRRAAGGVIALVVLATASSRAAADVRGQVVDARTGTAVAGATITGDDGTAVASGADGSFALAVATSSVTVVADGFTPALVAATAGPMRIALARDSDGEVVEVSGKAPDPATPTAYTLGRDQVRALPGGGNDVMRAIQTLPGVSRISYGIGGIVLRGATTGHNGVYLDGIAVPLAFHFAGLTAIYPSALLDGVDVTPGGADVAYGGHVGGMVVLRGRAPRADRGRFGGEVGVFDASAYAEGPAPGGGAVIAGLRRSYADAFLSEVLPADRWIVPRYYDGQLRWERGAVTAMAFFSDDRITSWGGTDYRQQFARAGVRVRQRRGATTVTLLPWVGVEHARVDYVFADPNRQRHQIDRLQLGLRVEVAHATAWGEVLGGAEAHQAFLHRSFSDTGSPAGGTDRRGWVTNVGAWAEARWRIGGGALTLKPGVRIDRFGAGGWVAEPRMVTTHELAPWFTLREELGLYHEAPGGDALNGDHAFMERAVHASIGARIELPAGGVASVTGYHVAGEGPPVSPEQRQLPSSGASGLGIVLDNLLGGQFGGAEAGRRRGLGAEVAIQRRTDRWLLWLAYTLARSSANRGGLEGWYPQWMDQTHNLNAVASVHVGAWQLGARLRWASGLRYTPLISGSGEVVVGGEGDSVWGPTNSARLADFVSLDLRVDRGWRRRWGTISAFLDVQNVTNADNPEGIGWTDGVAHVDRGLPILPMIGVGFQPPE